VIGGRVDNPYQEGSKSHAVFEALAQADRPLTPTEVAQAVGQQSTKIAHHVVKDLRSKGITVHRYRDPAGGAGAASRYSLVPVEGLSEVTTEVRRRGSRRARNGPPTAMVPSARQPLVGSPVRVTGLALADEELEARFECQGVVYRGAARKSQPVVGEWMTLVTVGLHGQGLYVDLAGSRLLTLEDITEVVDGAPE